MGQDGTGWDRMGCNAMDGMGWDGMDHSTERYMLIRKEDCLKYDDPIPSHLFLFHLHRRVFIFYNIFNQ
jgi:hypothetical protein